MKTINKQIQKAGVELITVVAILFATCVTINAQGSLSTNLTTYHNDLALSAFTTNELSYSVTTGTEVSAATFASYLENETEKELSLESWMIETGNFDAVIAETEKDDNLNIEKWMFNDSLFTTVKKDEANELIAKAGPAITNQAVGISIPGAKFGRRTFIHMEIEDPKLEFESWMLDKKIWNVENQTVENK